MDEVRRRFGSRAVVRGALVVPASSSQLPPSPHGTYPEGQ